MKYLFLDIDQVLNNAESHGYLVKCCEKKISREELDQFVKIMPCKYFNDDNINFDHVYIPIWKMLKDFIEKNDLVVVGISSWFSALGIRYEFDDIVKFLEYPMVDHTRYCGGSGKGRNDSILEYLKENNAEHCPYIILDDIYQGYYSLDHLVHINGRIGLTEEDLKKAEKILNE